MKRSVFPVFFLAVLLPLLPSVAATVTIGASKDNTLFQNPAGDESDGAGDSLFAGLTGSSDGTRIRRGTIAFDIAAALPANALITDVSLTLFADRVGSIAQFMTETVSLHALTADWGEGASAGSSGHPGVAAPGDATWIHRFYNTSFWTTPGGDFTAAESGSVSVSSPSQFYTWTGPGIVQDVQKWLTTPNSNFGWIIIGDEINPVTAIKFSSRQAFDSTFRPKLAITYSVVPEPSITPLLIAGATLLLGSRRRTPSSSSSSSSSSSPISPLFPPIPVSSRFSND